MSRRSRDSDEIDIEFDHLESTTRIVVTDNLNRARATVDDPTAIADVIEALGAHSDGWSVPEKGVPIARRRLNFYEDDRLLGNVGVGRTFLSALYRGGFLAHTVDDDGATYRRLMDLVGLGRPPVPEERPRRRRGPSAHR